MPPNMWYRVRSFLAEQGLRSYLVKMDLSFHILRRKEAGMVVAASMFRSLRQRANGFRLIAFSLLPNVVTLKPGKSTKVVRCCDLIGDFLLGDIRFQQYSSPDSPPMAVRWIYGGC